MQLKCRDYILLTFILTGERNRRAITTNHALLLRFLTKIPQCNDCIISKAWKVVLEIVPVFSLAKLL